MATYAALEELGFGFLHPLKPVVPTELCIRPPLPIHQRASPRWPERGFHIHTQHPLELTEVLQGFDIPTFGPHGPDCLHHTTFATETERYCERWEDMVDDVNRMMEWHVANRLNAVEWLMLGSYKWGDLNHSRLRHKRLRAMTALAHDYGLLVGADVPIAEKQQHAWYMVHTRTPYERQVRDIRERVDWIFGAGFDFIGTESGLSEFNHPDCRLMLDLMDEFADYVNHTWGRSAFVKVHCSTGQVCEDFPDPRTGEAVNFNFLTMFASPSMGVYPHTVQFYALDDPTAGAYGNDNFSEIAEYMHYEARLGNRSVVWYGETAYWVNVDVDVPLFLPIYGQRRLHDLRLIARREEREGARIQGQMNFDSGWEWSYWLWDVVTARASWDPLLSAAEDEWEAFAASLAPLRRVLPPGVGEAVTDALVRMTQEQEELLVHGRVGGQDSPNLRKLSGVAYLSGLDTWVHLPRLVGLSLTQPDRVHLLEHDDPWYPYVRPLLEEMEARLAPRAGDFAAAAAAGREQGAGDGAQELLDEMARSARLLALRARHSRLLYASRAPGTGEEEGARLQAEGRALIGEAKDIVRAQEAAYRVPWQRIGAWRDNPTVYRYGYVWAVHSLFYFWRDQGIAEGGSRESEVSPCWLNRMDATEVALGWGKLVLETLRGWILRFLPGQSGAMVASCIGPPSQEYEFPRDLFRELQH